MSDRAEDRTTSELTPEQQRMLLAKVLMIVDLRTQGRYQAFGDDLWISLNKVVWRWFQDEPQDAVDWTVAVAALCFTDVFDECGLAVVALPFVWEAVTANRFVDATDVAAIVEAAENQFESLVPRLEDDLVELAAGLWSGQVSLSEALTSARIVLDDQPA